MLPREQPHDHVLQVLISGEQMLSFGSHIHAMGPAG